jgi:hypothetical protein
MNTTLFFLPDGTVQGIYTEMIDLLCLGRLRVERVSTIEFDNTAQLWRVVNRAGQCVFDSTSRGQCVKWEQERLFDFPNMAA